jgi:hypothetical protein
LSACAFRFRQVLQQLPEPRECPHLDRMGMADRLFAQALPLSEYLLRCGDVHHELDLIDRRRRPERSFRFAKTKDHPIA